MAGDGRRQRGFPRMFTAIRAPSLPLAVTVVTTALLCALSATAQPQQQPPNNLPLPVAGAAAACPPPQATLLPCLSYFLGNSSTPAAACCAQIQAAFESQAPCLCAAMAAVPSQLGSAVGAAQALLLPIVCSLPPNACPTSSSAGPSSTTTSGTTTAAAAPAPAEMPNGADDPTVAGGGLKSVPGLLDSGAAASAHRGLPAAAVLVSVFVAYVF